jgi:hypothetical protein
MSTTMWPRNRLARLAGVATLVTAAWVAALPAAAIAPPAGAPRGGIVLVQGSCRVGEYASHDHAISVRNTLQSRGYDAWIVHHGSLHAGSRTYVVFVRC